MSKDWSMSKIWNMVLDKEEKREVKERDYIWSSELGGAMIDRFLKMKGTEPTNPPNARSRRKFFAGDVFEFILKLVLLQSGILKNHQKRISFQLPNCLRVSGKIDFYVGGDVNWTEAKRKSEEFWKSLEGDGEEEHDFVMFKKFSDEYINTLSVEYPDGLKKKILEFKSLSVFMFEKWLRVGKPDPKHANQAYSYLMDEAGEFDEAVVVYLCRDDARMMEYPIMKGTEKNETPVVEDIKEISNYVLNDIKPELEKKILWDKDEKKFTKNWKIEYSNYLTMLYGYKDPMEYAEETESKVSSWNRVVTRIKDKAEMTDKNEMYIEEMRGAGFNIHELLSNAK